MDKRPATQILAEHIDSLMREEFFKNSEQIHKALDDIGKSLGTEVSADFILGALSFLLLTQKKQLIRNLENLQSSDLYDPLNLSISKECEYLDRAIPDLNVPTDMLVRTIYCMLKFKQVVNSKFDNYPKIKEAIEQTEMMRIIKDDEVDPDIISDLSLLRTFLYIFRQIKLEQE